MTCRNDITGDKIQTKPTTKEYADNWDKIFGKQQGCKNKKCFCTGECRKENHPHQGYYQSQIEEKKNDREI